jgi:HK97 family phage major capsid protein
MTTATAPATGAELAEVLGEAGPVLDQAAQDAIRAYVQGQIQDGIQDRIQEGVQAGLAQFYRDNGVAEAQRVNLTPEAAPRNANPLHNRHAPGAVLDGKFENTGDLFRALWNERKGDRPAAERLGALRNDYSSTVPSEGGFLIPEEFRAELLRVAVATATVRPRARVIPMATPRIKFPMIDSTSNASTIYGGVAAYWTEEGAALTASSAKFGAVTLDAQKLTGYAEIPNELLADSAISVGAFVDQVFPEALAWFEDLAFMRGTGVGEPLGFMNAGNTALISVAKETGQGAASIVWENIVKMYSRMLPTSLASAVWIVNQSVFPELATMALSVGTGGSAVWLSNGQDGPPMTILGRPVIVSEKCEALGTVGDINFVDLNYYLVGDRQSMTASTSEHFKFNTDTTAYRIIQRVDGRPWIKNAITPNKGSSLSPFVQLATRS